MPLSFAREFFRKKMSSVERDNAQVMYRKLTHGETRYTLEGPETGPLLVCIHGWSTASYVWKPLKPELLNLGYRILTYDLYGRNYSARPDEEHELSLFTEQLEELLEKLELNHQRLNIIGYSMGGAIAARFVRQRLEHVDGLLLIAPAGMEVQWPPVREFLKERPIPMNEIARSAIPAIVRIGFWRQIRGHLDNPKAVEVYEKQKRELRYRGYVQALLSSVNGALSPKLKSEHEEIAASDVAVKAIFATDDITIPIKAKSLFDQWNTNGVSEEIENAGHGVTYTHVGEIMGKAREFLRL